MNKFADIVEENGPRLGKLDTVVSGKAAMYGKFEPSFVAEAFRCKN
jgi:hypothetical protein